MASGTIFNHNVVSNIYFKRRDVSSGNQFTIPSGYRGILAVTDSTQNRNGLYILFSTGGGVVGYKPIQSAEDFTLITATNKLTITLSAGTRTIFVAGNNNCFD